MSKAKKQTLYGIWMCSFMFSKLLIDHNIHKVYPVSTSLIDK